MNCLVFFIVRVEINKNLLKLNPFMKTGSYSLLSERNNLYKNIPEYLILEGDIIV